ncbi:hypothetical protein F2P56_011946 [Juglans regia]|uniref:Uncharacterized protein n=1 Tax=Juglans regia TaxID=51240 RepID=A0A833XKV9_JUGRE|nr:hypothetical protein F2P56_011946 [Juglans regia]
MTATWVMCDYFDVLFLVWEGAEIDERFTIMPRGLQFTHLSGIGLLFLNVGMLAALLFFRKHINVCNCLRDEEKVSFAIVPFILFLIHGYCVFCSFVSIL